MLLLAVSALDKVKDVPPATWAKIGIGLAAVIVVVVLYRRILKINKVVLGVISFVVVVIVFFSWVYNRNEPRFLTPLVNRIAPFFPSAGSYDAKQQSTPKP